MKKLFQRSYRFLITFLATFSALLTFLYVNFKYSNFYNAPMYHMLLMIERIYTVGSIITTYEYLGCAGWWVWLTGYALYLLRLC